MRYVVGMCLLIGCAAPKPVSSPTQTTDTEDEDQAPTMGGNVANHDEPPAPPPSPSGTTTTNAEGEMQMPPPVPDTAQEGSGGYLWPLGGSDGVDWVINNYVDLDPTASLLDYKGGAKTYDGHKGIDIDLPTFRAMDKGTDVLAITEGVVETVVSGFEDRHVACINNDWNVVTVRHADASLVMYGHLQKGSPTVSVGDKVTQGQVLGHVGSSGCSTVVHLHLELHDASDNVVEPFLVSAWKMPPSYVTPFNIMDMSLRAGAYSNVDQVKDPGNDVTQMAAGQTLGVAFSVAGGTSGDMLTVQCVRENGTIAHHGTVTFNQIYRHSYWYWSFTLSNTPGAWTIRGLVNGEEVMRRPLQVN